MKSTFSARRCAVLLSLILSGCATFSDDAGFDDVAKAAKEHLDQEVTWARNEAQPDGLTRRINALLAEPLTESNAVQIALLNNRGLQADFQELGISEAELVSAGTLPNPGFSFGKFRSGDETEIERKWHISLTRLMFLPTLSKLAGRAHEQNKQRVTGRMVTLAAETKKAFVDAVAAEQRLRYMREVKKTADTGAQLARRMARVGNFTKLQQAREQGFYADAVLNLTRAQRAQFSAREKLTRLLGLWGSQTAFELPERLPDLPDKPLELPNAEQLAMGQRLDIRSARLNIQNMASTIGMSKVSRFINVLEFGYERETSSEGERRTGYEVGFEVPIFNWSGARVRMAEAAYMRAVHETAEMAINARSEVRDAYYGYRAAYDIARLYRDEVVPTAKRISEENLYRYNGMLIGVFELLADARSQVAAVDGYIQALRDFWATKADLDMAMLGKPGSTMLSAGSVSTGGDAGGH